MNSDLANTDVLLSLIALTVEANVVNLSTVATVHAIRKKVHRSGQTTSKPVQHQRGL